MYLCHLFHGQTIRVHWMPTNLCENCHCEYHNFIIPLIIEVVLGNLIICLFSNINHMSYFSMCLYVYAFCHLIFHLIIFIIIVIQSSGDSQKAQDSPVSQQTGKHYNVQLDDEEIEGLKS